MAIFQLQASVIDFDCPLQILDVQMPVHYALSSFHLNFFLIFYAKQAIELRTRPRHC
jgi:hypothetical protein